MPELRDDRVARHQVNESFYAAAEQRLGRTLLKGERHVDVVQILSELEHGKQRLRRAILKEQKRVALAAADGRHDAEMRVTPDMIRALNWLHELGQREARKELRRHGIEPSKAYARPRSDAIRRLANRLGGWLPKISVRTHGRAVQAQLAGESQRAILETASRVPGALDAAGRLVSSAYYAGMGDVFSTSADLIQSWVHSAILDGATCGPCEEGDGTEYPTWDEAMTDFPDGGPYVDCDGEGRCRCRLVPTGPAEEQPVATGEPPAPLPGDDVSFPGYEPISAHTLETIKSHALDTPFSDQLLTPLAKELLGPGNVDTLDKLLAGGPWAEERQLLNDKIRRSFFEGKTPPPEAATRHHLFTSGGGAAGKGSSVFNVDGKMQTLKQLKARKDFVVVDPDVIKAAYPEYEKLAASGDLHAASVVHEESSRLAKDIIARAVREGFNVVTDTTGSNASFLDVKILEARDAGYRVQVTMTSAPTNAAMDRAIIRGDKTGRYVNIPALKKAHSGASEQLARWMNSSAVSEWRVIDTTGRPRLVARGGGGRKLIFVDRAALDKILAKAHERGLG